MRTRTASRTERFAEAALAFLLSLGCALIAYGLLRYFVGASTRAAIIASAAYGLYVRDYLEREERSS